MTHEIKDAPPAGCEDKECTHEHIVAHSLTIKSPGAKGSVSILANTFASGVWVNSGEQTECIGLVAQKGLPPYLVIWPAGQAGQPSGLPLAVCDDRIQLPGKATTNPTVIPFADLLEAIRLVVKAKAE